MLEGYTNGYWLARDWSSRLWIFDSRPEKNRQDGTWFGRNKSMVLGVFRLDITYDNSPKYITINKDDSRKV